MKKQHIIGILVLALSIAVVNPVRAQQEVRIGMSDFPPLTITADWSGIFPDLFNELFKDSEYTPVFKSTPYARGFHSLTEGSVDIGIFAEISAKSKPGFLDAVDIGKPFFHSVSGFVYNTEKHPDLVMNDISDLKGMTMRAIIGTSNQRFSDAGLIVSETPNVPAMLQMVEAKRADLFLITDVIAFYLSATQFPQSQDKLQILYEKPPLILNMVLGISKQLPDHKKLRQTINDRLQEMITDGTYRAILDKYYQGRGQPDLAIPYSAYGLAKPQ